MTIIIVALKILELLLSIIFLKAEIERENAFDTTFDFKKLKQNFKNYYFFR